MLQVEVKSKRNTAFELEVRHFIKQNAKDCSSLSSFEYSLKEDLLKSKPQTTVRIHHVYRIENDGTNVKVFWVSPTKNEQRLIAIIKE